LLVRLLAFRMMSQDAKFAGAKKNLLLARAVLEIPVLSSNRGEIPKVPFVEVERRRAADLPYGQIYHMRGILAITSPAIDRRSSRGGRLGLVRNGQTAPPLEFFKARLGSKMVDVSYEERMSFADCIYWRRSRVRTCTACSFAGVCPNCCRTVIHRPIRLSVPPGRPADAA
jgi:hypothetical protein